MTVQTLLATSTSRELTGWRLLGGIEAEERESDDELIAGVLADAARAEEEDTGPDAD